jgi:RNA polymerase sigma factor (sigma-70 family)
MRWRTRFRICGCAWRGSTPNRSTSPFPFYAAWEKIQPQPAEYADPERIASGRSELAQAHALIARMPERMREAFTLFRFEERPQRDIAEHMGITVSAVEKLLRRAYQFLHENREVEGADRTRWRRPGSGRSGDE